MVINNSTNIIKIIFCLTLFLMSCREDIKLLNELELRDSLYYHNGQLFNGVAKEYYSNGTLRTEKYFNYGQQNGIHRTYYENTQKMREIKPIGNQGGYLILTWYDNGQMSTKTLIKSNVAGDVEFDMWDSNGNKIESTFQEWLLFLKSQGKDFGFNPSKEDLKKIRSSIKDSLLKE